MFWWKDKKLPKISKHRKEQRLVKAISHGGANHNRHDAQ